MLAIVLASCIGFLFARTLVRPVNTMAQTARAIKEGDLSARTGIRGEDEIARLGIGLSVAKEIVDRHNGYVDVEGEKGVGACFTINLPLYYEGDEQREQRQQQRQQREQQQQQRQQQREAQRQQKEQQRAQQHAQKTGIPFGRSHDDGK